MDQQRWFEISLSPQINIKIEIVTKNSSSPWNQKKTGLITYMQVFKITKMWNLGYTMWIFPKLLTNPEILVRIIQ